MPPLLHQSRTGRGIVVCSMLGLLHSILTSGRNWVFPVRLGSLPRELDFEKAGGSGRVSKKPVSNLFDIKMALTIQ